jgi:hypothetical protein
MRRKRKRPEELWVKVQRLGETALADTTKLSPPLNKDEQRWLLSKRLRRNRPGRPFR